MKSILSIVFDKKTPIGKGLRTAYQGLVSFLVHLPFILVLPEVQELVKTYPAWFVIYLNAFAGIVAYFQNSKGR